MQLQLSNFLLVTGSLPQRQSIHGLNCKSLKFNDFSFIFCIFNDLLMKMVYVYVSFRLHIHFM